MIVQGNSYSSASFWSKHLLRADTNERVSIEEMRGLTSETVRDALYEMREIGQAAGVEKGFYIASLNTKADEPLSPEQWRWAADRLERELRLEGQARFIVAHTKDDAEGESRTHWHVCWSRIDVDTMHAISDSHNFRRHELAARDIEREFDLTPVQSTLTRDKEKTPRPERCPDGYETFRAMDTGIDPQEVKRELTALWMEADSGRAFQAALEEAGYILAKGDRRDFCVIDAAGDEHSLTRRISGVKTAEIRARMADVDREALPSVEDARAMARANAEASGGPIADTLTPAMLEDAEQGGKVPDAVAQHAAEHAEPVADDTATGAARVLPEPRGWKDRMRHLRDTLLEFWHDETSGTPQENRGFVARLVDSGRRLARAWGRHDPYELMDALSDAGELSTEAYDEVLSHIEDGHHAQHHGPGRETARPVAPVDAAEPDARPQAKPEAAEVAAEEAHAHDAAEFSALDWDMLGEEENDLGQPDEAEATPPEGEAEQVPEPDETPELDEGPDID